MLEGIATVRLMLVTQELGTATMPPNSPLSARPGSERSGLADQRDAQGLE